MDTFADSAPNHETNGVKKLCRIQCLVLMTSKEMPLFKMTHPPPGGVMNDDLNFWNVPWTFSGKTHISFS